MKKTKEEAVKIIIGLVVLLSLVSINVFGITYDAHHNKSDDYILTVFSELNLVFIITFGPAIYTMIIAYICGMLKK
ncbi:hypothetical protein [Rahnella sp. CJA17(1/100)]|uniref:hypothetical protein n=1 Tax=Rahnella sp. CJA17(1/100) TaxID=2508951 RepID=UPI00106F8D06|nr:hypothetical protein [Rahnella sp. CJA17(1/100)]